MENELIRAIPITPPVAFILEGKPAATAVGYVVLGFTALGICTIFKGYSLNLGKLTLSPAA